MICVDFEVNFVSDNRSRLDAHLLLFKTCLQLMQLLTIKYDYKAAVLHQLQFYNRSFRPVAFSA